MNSHSRKCITGTLMLLGAVGCLLGRDQAGAAAEAPKRSLTIPTWLTPAQPAPAKKPGTGPAEKTAAVPAMVPATPGPDCLVACGTPLPLSGVAFSPDKKLLAVGGYREVLLWDLVEAKLAKRLGVGQIGTMVQSVVFTKDGQGLAAAEGTPYAAGAVKVFDVQSGQVIVDFREPKGVVYSLALSPDGKSLAAGCSDWLAYVWDLEQKKLVATLKKHALPVVSVAFSNDGKYLATASLDKTIQVWDAAGWKAMRNVARLPSPAQRCLIRLVRAFPKEQYFGFGMVLGGHDNRSVQLLMDDTTPPWFRHEAKADLFAASPLDCLWVKSKAPGKTAQNHVYIAASDNTVKVFFHGGEGVMEPEATLAGHSGWVYGLAVNADETRIASASGDGSVKLWSLPDNNLLATFVQLAPETDQWAIVSGPGYYAASTPGAIAWKTSGPQPAAEKLAARQNPELVRQVLAGKKTPR